MTSGLDRFFAALRMTGGAQNDIKNVWNEGAGRFRLSGAAGNYASYIYNPSGSGFHKAVGTQFYVSNSGDYTDNILTGEWTSVHEYCHPA